MWPLYWQPGVSSSTTNPEMSFQSLFGSCLSVSYIALHIKLGSTSCLVSHSKLCDDSYTHTKL
eukprot:m.57664 g.57664  ORF g.57664 m.57664 type:complete len:63 (+) comp13739_c0_seq8:263-451(+)